MELIAFLYFLFLSQIGDGQSGCQTSYSNMAINGNDLVNITGSSSSCCQSCQQQSGCAAYTWTSDNGGTCWLKNDTQPLYSSNGAFTVMMTPNPANTYVLNVSYDASNFFDNVGFQLGSADCGCFVNYTDKYTAQNAGLIKIVNNKVFMGVDNVTVLPPNSTIGRNSVNVRTLHTFNSGLFILSLDHVPTGTTLWPAFWSYGPDWPNSGEIDILESICGNDSYRDFNQITLHTGKGCAMPEDNSKYYTGQGLDRVCDSNSTVNHGCGVKAPKGTYNLPFNQAGGGVLAAEWDREKFIRVWNFVQPNIPSDIVNNSPNPNPSTWGMPTAYFAIGPNCTSDHFQNHTVIFDMALCGWAASVVDGDCEEIVRSKPENYSEAYWLINYLKVFCKPGDQCRLS